MEPRALRSRYSLECKTGYLHRVGGETVHLFALHEHERQRQRIEEAARRVDSQRPRCGPHRVGGPYVA